MEKKQTHNKNGTLNTEQLSNGTHTNTHQKNGETTLSTPNSSQTSNDKVSHMCNAPNVTQEKVVQTTTSSGENNTRLEMTASTEEPSRNGQITHSNSQDSGTECNNGSEETTTTGPDSVSNINSACSEDGHSSSDIDSIPASPLNTNNNGNDTVDCTSDIVPTSSSSKRQAGQSSRRLEKAATLFQKGDYATAADIYTKCLEDLKETAQKELRISLHFNRSATHLKLKHYDKVIQDCNAVLSLDGKNSKALSRKIKALCSVGDFSAAHQVAHQWTITDPKSAQAKKEVERLAIIVDALQDQDVEEDGLVVEEPLMSGVRVPPEGREDDASNTAAAAASPQQGATAAVSPPLSFSASLSDDNSVGSADNGDMYSCSYCSISFSTQAELRTHCHGDLHKKKVSSDEGRDWSYRSPPRGLTADEYTKCPRYFGEGTCRFGDKCSQAHSDQELSEWKERFEYKRERMRRAKENHLQSNSYAEHLLEKWMTAENPETVMTDNMDGVNIHANSDLSVTMTSKRSSNSWMFTVTSKVCLKRVALLDDASRRHFHISSITVGPKRAQKSQKIEDHCQDWSNQVYTAARSSNEKVYRIKIIYRTDIYGTFRQSVIFDFGSEPVLVRQVCVDSSPVVDIDKLTQSLILSESGRWDLTTKQIQTFQPKVYSLDEEDVALLEQFPPPMAANFTISETLLDPELRDVNYKTRMHDLLYIEEMAQFSSIAKYNVKASLQIVNRFLLMPSSVSTAKFAQSGELFARMKLNSDLSEDTAHGRLILQNVNTVYLAPYDTNSEVHADPKLVYEAMVEEKGRNFIFLRLSAKCVKELKLEADIEFQAQVQFHLNRLPLCEMHLAVERLPNLNFVFPDVTSIPSIPWTPQRQWGDKLDARLNAKQKEAIVAITTPLQFPLPPILIVGPYGTGKTFTLAQAALQILHQPDTRVLICTHSNSAADLYIRDYLHPYVQEGHREATPLRILYKHRWYQTVNSVVLEYSLVNSKDGFMLGFHKPTKEDIMKHRIIVATLSTSQYLYNLDLEPGFFTHILLDEAAQAQESETIMPLAMAGENTRIVLAGDHMQLSPEVHSDFARDRNLHISYLERLYDLYPINNPCKILLCENYRSHRAIIEYTSELFYDNKLVTSGTQPRHEVFYPLTFFTARGEDMQHQNSTAFYNNAEVYEIVERVSELQKMWPKSWGPQDEFSIGVVSPYADQVQRIRAELRKRKLGTISVERVLNVQGKQFRAIFLSTVRTRHTCSSDSSLEDYMDYGFLSNVKLLNTAITRAQSLVAVVGDPVSLCSIGKCRKLWERFIEICFKSNSLYGITWNHLRAQLDGVELKKTYILNPLAPEFIPNRLRHAAYSPPEPVAVGKYGYTFASQQSSTWTQPRPPHFSHLPPHMPSHQMYYSAMMPVAVGGAMALGYQHVAPQLWGPRGAAGISQAAKLTGSPVQLTSSASSTPSPASSSTKTAPSPASSITKSSPSNTKSPELAMSPGSGAMPKSMPTAQVAAGAPLHQAGPRQPAYQQAMPYRMAYPSHAYPNPHGPFFPPMAQPYLLSPGRTSVPTSVPAMPPHPLLGHAIGPRMMAPRGAPPSILPHGLPPGGGHLQHVPHNELPERSKLLNVSPTPPSLSTTGVPSSQYQILPNVCNASASSPQASPGTMADPTGASRPSPQLPHPMMAKLKGSDELMLIQNPFLQQEFFRYILQSSGPAAANSFMQYIQTKQQQKQADRQQQHQQQQQQSQSHAQPHHHPPVSQSQGMPQRSGPGWQMGYHHQVAPHHAATGQRFLNSSGDGYGHRPEQQSSESPSKSKPKRETVSVRLEEPSPHNISLPTDHPGHASSRDRYMQRGGAPWREAAQSQHASCSYSHANNSQPSKLSYSRAVASSNNGFLQAEEGAYNNQAFRPYNLAKYSMHGQQSAHLNIGQHDSAIVHRTPSLQDQDSAIVHSSRCIPHHENAIVRTREDLLNDMEMPSAVDHMVRFIENSLEDKSSEMDLGNIHIGQSAVKVQVPGLSGQLAADRPVPLYMRRAGQSVSQTQPGMSYAGALRSQPSTTPPAGATGGSMPNTSLVEEGLELLHDGPSQATLHQRGLSQIKVMDGQQTSTSPPDPLDLLKNLNIKASPGTQALYHYFS